MKVLLSGGGTGGHVYPAIAIANKIKEENPDAEILFVGTEKGIESEIVPKYGYELKTVTVQGFKRKIDLDNVKRVFKLFKGLEQSRKVVKKFKPDIVIGINTIFRLTISRTNFKLFHNKFLHWIIINHEIFQYFLASFTLC